MISKSLTEILKKNNFSWNDTAAATFLALKEAMMTTPVLALPDFSHPFTVETDACNVGIGAVLLQFGRPFGLYKQGTPTKEAWTLYVRKGIIGYSICHTKVETLLARPQIHN